MTVIKDQNKGIKHIKYLRTGRSENLGDRQSVSNLGIFSVIPSGFAILSMLFSIFMRNVGKNINFLLKQIMDAKNPDRTVTINDNKLHVTYSVT